MNEISNLNNNNFEILSNYKPSGDQPQAIDELVDGLVNNERDQVLLGVTGSGKTFTMGNVIKHFSRPTLILAPNKTLAAQLYGEMKELFPENAVEYFVSYYDYYQPEAYVPRSDTYIEKDASINEQIDRMRHSATRSLLMRQDVIIVASVSCIYGIGSLETYSEMTLVIEVNKELNQQSIINRLVELQYKRNDINFKRGTFRKRGDVLEIFPSHLEDTAWKISFFGDEIELIFEFDPLTGEKIREIDRIKIFANSHYVTPKPTLRNAIKEIKTDLKNRLNEFYSNNKILEAQRLEQRTNFDLEMMEATGSCTGIENYSRYLSSRNPGEPPPTLFEYLPENSLLIVDESHVTIPQLGAMYKGDASRKKTLSDYGFRLPSCLDNRPLKFQEWELFRPQTIYVSATECRVVTEQNQRVLITTLTKKMAESLTEFMNEAGLKVRYLHSDIDTLERIEIIRDLRLGVFDILIGINLLREGLDIPECGLVAILDADKEGFLRSKTSLVQTIGRAARNVNGRVILYADIITGSLDYALNETKRRREKQEKYNLENNIKPESIIKNISNIIEFNESNNTNDKLVSNIKNKSSPEEMIKDLEIKMKDAAANLEFEEAAKLRDTIRKLEHKHLGLKLK